MDMSLSAAYNFLSRRISRISFTIASEENTFFRKRLKLLQS